MSKPSHIARYYADDKDVFDLLSQGNVSMPKLHTFLRQRGIVVSPSLEKEEIARYFQRSPLSWPQLENLLSLIERAEREDKFTTCRLQTDGSDIESIIKIVATIQTDRGERCGEVYKTEKVGDGRIEITVNYSEPNFSKTRCLQKDDKSLVIQLDKSADGYKVRRHDNERSEAIFNDLENRLAANIPEPKKRREITVSGLTSTQRSKFFVELARGIPGYDLKDEKGLRVDRPEAEDEPEDAEAEEEKKKVEEEFRGMVKRAILHGTSLLMSREYQNYAKDGYSISKLAWAVEESGGTGKVVEFSAEFNDGEQGTGFQYRVLGKFERKEDGSLGKSRVSVSGIEKDKLLSLLEECAFSALEKASAQPDADAASDPTKEV